MANKRTLKHGINLICEELFAEAVAATLYGHNPNQDNAEVLLSCIIRLKNEYTCRVGHPEPGMKPSTFYKVLREEFSERVSEIVDQISNL